MLKKISLPSDELCINKSEVFRYLGYNKNMSDEKVSAITDEIISEFLKSISLKAIYKKFDIKFLDNGKLDLGFLSLHSKNLQQNLKDCTEIYLFAATIGVFPDRLIQKYTHTSPSKAVISQAVGAAAIEAWCDFVYNKLKSEESLSEKYLRPRFSPGYGDFPLEAQKDIFSALDVQRKIGITLTDGYLMMPSKSVTAIVGVSNINTKCIPDGCEACNNQKCEYRRI